MMAVFCGAVGALLVIAVLALGVIIGWKAREMPGRRCAAERNGEEKGRMGEEQRAFEDMLHYNMNTAYGMNGGLERLMGGEND